MWPIKTCGQSAGSITWSSKRSTSTSAVSRLGAKPRDSHIPTIGRGIPDYERWPAPVGASGTQKREKRRQVGGPRIHARENLPTAGGGDRTHLPPVSALRQPTHPSSGPGQRTARGEGSSSLGQAFFRARPLRPKHRSRRLSLRIPRPPVAPESSANGSPLGGAPVGSAERPPRRVGLGISLTTSTQCHPPPDIPQQDDHCSNPSVMPAVS